jgi:hypothetical protein
MQVVIDFYQNDTPIVCELVLESISRSLKIETIKMKEVLRNVFERDLRCQFYRQNVRPIPANDLMSTITARVNL